MGDRARVSGRRGICAPLDMNANPTPTLSDIVAANAAMPFIVFATARKHSAPLYTLKRLSFALTGPETQAPNTRGTC